MSETKRIGRIADITTADKAEDAGGTTIITKQFTFDAAHYLPHVPEDHKCRRMHGHTYQVQLHLTGPMDNASGWIVDFGDIKQAWKPIQEQLDHRLLNEVEGLENPTAERIAAWIWRQFEARRHDLGLPGVLAAVELAETHNSSVLFIPPGIEPWVPGHPELHLTPSQERLYAPSQPRTDTARQGESDAPRRVRCAAGAIEDVQARNDTRGIALDEVGVTRVRVPITVLDRERTQQTTVAYVTMGVDLAANVKGAHLSRFMQVLRKRDESLTLFSLAALTRELRQHLDARRCRVRLEFPYFLTKAAPVTGELGEVDIDCAFEVIDVDSKLQHWLETRVPVTTVCPCSKDISDYGAHNQRGTIKIRIRCAQDEADLPALVWIEELVEIAESAASSPVYSVVKRPDERYLTMTGYDKPQFVEDVARDAALALSQDERIVNFEVTAENEESIHAHNAYATVRGPRAEGPAVVRGHGQLAIGQEEELKPGD